MDASSSGSLSTISVARSGDATKVNSYERLEGVWRL